ncbi:MAG: sulfatase [Sphaerochaetaceae bacterium]|nr:sulfatase [Sphaerochaetaceae bacterium]
MRSISIMYDSLNRNMLSPYGNTETITPNFQRLARHSVKFDTFYAGSLPCMPARRELHTGRYNFLHRSWGPIEPFDISAFQLLSANGVYTHFISDHAHYWQEGGLTYHNRYSSYEFIRGQEGDLCVGDSHGYGGTMDLHRQDGINRKKFVKEEDFPHARCYKSALEFLERNKDNGNWHLHLEFFDPHEPFTVPGRFLEMYGLNPDDSQDWPAYDTVAHQQEDESYRLHYCALLTMCDEYLGKLLDYMDANGMWDDTLLTVNTDHGYLLGEHGYYAKNYMPMYEEIARLPFFLWNPAAGNKNRTCGQLAQTIDIAPTLLDYHHVPIPREMQGKSLLPVAASGARIHDFVLFGEFGKHVNITDGRFVYMRAGRNENLNEYTMMPTHIFTPFSVEELKKTDKELTTCFQFTQGVPVMKIPATTANAPDNSCYWYDRHMKYGDLLFDLHIDPCQKTPVCDIGVETEMIGHLIEELKKSDSPIEQYDRLGLQLQRKDV